VRWSSRSASSTGSTRGRPTRRATRTTTSRSCPPSRGAARPTTRRGCAITLSLPPVAPARAARAARLLWSLLPWREAAVGVEAPCDAVARACAAAQHALCESAPGERVLRWLAGECSCLGPLALGPDASARRVSAAGCLSRRRRAALGSLAPVRGKSPAAPERCGRPRRRCSCSTACSARASLRTSSPSTRPSAPRVRARRARLPSLARRGLLARAARPLVCSRWCLEHVRIMHAGARQLQKTRAAASCVRGGAAKAGTAGQAPA